jgi:outer membrane protein, multidrug efflux system
MSRSLTGSNTERVRQVLATALASSMLLVLSSCAVPFLRKAEVAPPLPATFNGEASPDNSAQLGIKEFFNDPNLTGLIDQAVINNRELKILNEEVQVAASVILQRRGAYLPFVGFRGSASVERFSTFTLPGAGVHDDPYLNRMFLPNPLPDYLLSLPLYWQIDIWRELRNARDAAFQRYLAAVEKRNYFVTKLVAEIGDNYYALMAFDKRLENLDQIIALQEQSLEFAKAQLGAGRDTALATQRFLAEVRKNQSQKLIVRQDIIQAENRINFLLNRFPEPVERSAARFFELSFPLNVGVPAQLLQNRPDIRQAERELEAAGLDVMVARAHFFPKLDITAGVGYEAFNPKYLFWTPDAVIYNAAGELVGPLINKKAIQAEYLSANAKQLESLYNYQRLILNAFTEVVNRVTTVENYGRSIELKRQQLEALVASVDIASQLFKAARIDFINVLFAQRDLIDARAVLIDTRQQQLSAIVHGYQALGGGVLIPPPPQGGTPTGHKFFHLWAPPTPAPAEPPLPALGPVPGAAAPVPGAVAPVPGAAAPVPGAAAPLTETPAPGSRSEVPRKVDSPAP